MSGLGRCLAGEVDCICKWRRNGAGLVGMSHASYGCMTTMRCTRVVSLFIIAALAWVGCDRSSSQSKGPLDAAVPLVSTGGMPATGGAVGGAGGKGTLPTGGASTGQGGVTSGGIPATGGTVGGAGGKGALPTGGVIAGQGGSSVDSGVATGGVATGQGGSRMDGGGGAGGTGNDAGAADAPAVLSDARDGIATDAARYCTGHVPTPFNNTCRKLADCVGSPVVCSVGYYNWGPAACPIPPNMQPCPMECSADKDCAARAGGSCVPYARDCPQCNGRVCQYPPPPCTMTPDSCAAGTRCRTDGSCEPIPCTDGFACGDGNRCNPTSAHASMNGCEFVPCDQGYTCLGDTRCNVTSKNADGHGCEPTPCDQGYTCGADMRCNVGSAPAYTHGCEPTPCGQGYVCPENTRCTGVSTDVSSHGCMMATCASDGDCDCGFCMGGYCSADLGTCQHPPA